MSIISIENLTKDYNKKGIFDLNLKVEKGCVFGFLGPNGAGKTTTIRNLLGFIKPTLGRCEINGLDCFKDYAKIQKSLGYLPGETAFINEMTGDEFIKFYGSLKGMSDYSRVNELKKILDFTQNIKIKKMSKGTKQKIAIICAFMANPDILILDEPSSGLDPLMQNRFIEMILKEKEKGTTIFLSSHIFEEIEKCCDAAAIIKDGRLVANEKIAKLSQTKSKTYIITFEDESEAKSCAEKFEQSNLLKNTLEITLSGSPRELINYLYEKNIVSFDVKTQSLEEVFMHFYGGKEI